MVSSFLKKYYELSRIVGHTYAPFCFLYFIIHRLLESISMFFLRCVFPVNNHLVIFRSMPDYADNARALAEYMLDNGYANKYSIYYDVSDARKYNNTGSQMKFISCETKLGLYRLKNLKLVVTAKYLMSTHKPILIRNRARKEQLIINLWHGCGYKDKSSHQGSGHANFDYAIVPGELFVKPKSYFWNIEEEKILPIGYPRYDWLKAVDKGARKVLDSFKRDAESKVVLWMPTYRADKRGVYTDSNSITQFPLVDRVEKWQELDRCCEKLDIVLIVKLHPFQREYGIPFDSFTNIKEIANLVFEDSDVPMYKFIALTDALISDYSSVAVDYLLVDRPIAFTLDDYEEYKSTRGFVFDDPRVYMPGHHLYSSEDLMRFLHDVSTGVDSYKEERDRMKTYAICQSENYCKSLLERFCIN